MITKKEIGVFCAIFSLLIFFCSCKEFIEASLEDSLISQNAPADSTESTQYLQSFWWDTVDDALFYRLQVVTPNFSKPVNFILDTLISDNKFNLTLEPGSYEWRVRAENGSSKGLFSIRYFIIHPSSISNQSVQLKLPLDASVTNQARVIFSWYKLFGAERYRFQADTALGNFLDEDHLFYNSATLQDNVSVELGTDGVLYWRVRAENDSTQSKWSSIFRITHDATEPQKVSLLSPADNAQTPLPIVLTWNSIAEAKQYQVYVSASNDSTQTLNDSFPVTVNTNSFRFSSVNYGEKIYWKVRAVDLAGNKGEYSSFRSFIVQ